MNRDLKILVLNYQFERGGAARVASILINEMRTRGYDVTVVTDSIGWKVTYPLYDVKIKNIQTKIDNNNLFFKLKKWISCVKTIRRYIKEEKPNVIIATEAIMFLCAWIANVGQAIPVIAADHTSFKRKIHPLLDFIRFHLYSKADGLSILTKKDEKLLGDKFPKKRIIYNPLSFPIQNLDKWSKRKNILCAGRLEVWHIKGFDIILQLWGQIATKHPDWILEIAGSSSDEKGRSYIEDLINKYGLSNRVRLLGQIEDMEKLYSETSIFVLPSRMEGFPMVLLEAMSQGCACVAFDVQGACSEMIIDDSEGIVVRDGDIDGFRKSLEKLLNSSSIREQLSRNAQKRAAFFSVDRFISQWEDYISEIISNYSTSKVQ